MQGQPGMTAEIPTDASVIDWAGLQALFDHLHRDGYVVVGPAVRDGAIVYDEIAGVDDLPAGWTDRQEAGSYRLQRRDDEAVFGYAASPHAWKRFLHPASVRLWQAKRTSEGFSVTGGEPPPRYAFIGVRACDLQAIAVQDRVFMEGAHVDPDYATRREGSFIVAVNCGEAGGTCFCVSMNTGPKAAAGFDLSLTELVGGSGHRFLVEVGSARGAGFLAALPHRPADFADETAAMKVVERTAASMGRSLDATGVKELLQANAEHPRWQDVAARCLTCGNCTMVCPTCFCTTIEDTTDLAGDTAERWRKWDSCFSLEFSYINGGSVRTSPDTRYRHWITHKLASWYDQFDMSGCVGCGRCITWCPVGIDITQEVAAIRDAPRKTGAGSVA